MAAYDLEEQERIDALKDWWDKWGVWVYAGVGAFVLGMAAVQGWRYYQNQQNVEAETLFRSIEKTAAEVVASKESKKLSEAAIAIGDKFPGSFQASEAQLMAAKAAFEANDLSSAKTHLQWVVDKGRDTYKPLARVRLAGVLLDEKKYDEALKLLDQVKEDGFVAMAADLRGDIFAVQGRKDEARAAYQVAVDKSLERSPLKAISQAKLDAAGGAATRPAESKDDAKASATSEKDGKGTK